MRQIGTIPSRDDAKRLADYLLTLGITTRVDDRPSGSLVWVHHEDKVDKARAEMAEFLKDPANARYDGVEQTAKALRKKKQQEDREHIRKSVALRGFWDYRPVESVPVTMVLVATSIIVAVVTHMGMQQGNLLSKLWISPISVQAPTDRPVLAGGSDGVSPIYAPDSWVRSEGLSPIRKGDVWRLVSPIFIHFGIWHLVFCLYWLNDLGGMIEIRRGTFWLLALVLGIAIPSNLAQYFFAGPRFGGMMPVILGLFAFIRIQTYFLPNVSLPTRANTEIILALGFLASLAGFFAVQEGMANLVGIGMGLLFGAIPVVRKRLAGRPWK